MTERKLFGTDGIRGIANKHPMTPEVSLRLGKALTAFLKKNVSDSPKILIGKDTRLSGYIFEQAISSGITSMGGEAMFVGPLPTPAIAFLTSNMRADAGVVISASHNPYQDNGIKLFDRNGFKLPDSTESKIEKLMLDEKISLQGNPSEIGKARRINDAIGRYVVFLKNTFPRDLTLDGLRIVLDCANGAAYKVAPLIFEELGAKVTTIGVNPDGKNINVNCGSLNPKILKDKVFELGADVGIALDGDADRVIFCDEKGNAVDGDKIIAISASDMIENCTLRSDTVVATQMSNIALEKYLNEKKIKLERTNVGDRYVVEAMKKNGSNLGGEKSGHLIYLDHTTTGDGLIASLQLLAIMKKNGKPLSELSEIIKLFPQTLNSFKVSEKKPFEQIEGLKELVAKYENELDSNGRINLRYSGTEQLARVMVEGDNEIKINKIADDISTFILERIGDINA